MKIAACTLFALVAAASAQGPLTPPAGPPQPNLRTLEQIEPRIPLNVTTTPGNASAVHVISTPGSYYLTGNLSGVAGKNGILIEASNVTLDLGGFSITGVASSLSGVALSSSNTARSAITIRNGLITGFGERGIYNAGTAAIDNLLAEDLTISCQGDAIRAGDGATVVRRVMAKGGSGGIKCINSTSLDQVTDCTVTGISGEGIFADVVENCQLSHMNLSGFFVVNAKKVSNTRIANITGGGLMVAISADMVTGSSVSDFGSTGTAPVSAIIADHVENCRVCKVFAAGGNVAGIEKQTVDAGMVKDCIVTDLKSSGSATVSGINSGTVEGCHLNKIGYQSATGAVSGITATSRVSQCSLSVVGHTAVTGNVSGVAAGSSLPNLGSGKVSGVELRTIQGTGQIIGILAADISDSLIDSLSQQSSTAAAYAASGLKIHNCTAQSLSAKTSNGSSCAFVGDLITSCRVENANNGTAFVGMGGIMGVAVEDCSVTSAFGVGIRTYGGASRVLRCSVSNNNIFTGISFGAAGGTIEGCTVDTGNNGITTDASSKVIVRGNIVTNCSTKYSLGAATRAGPIITATGTISSTNPFANFSD